MRFTLTQNDVNLDNYWLFFSPRTETYVRGLLDAFGNFAFKNETLRVRPSAKVASVYFGGQVLVIADFLFVEWVWVVLESWKHHHQRFSSAGGSGVSSGGSDAPIAGTCAPGRYRSGGSI